ncbi:MAG: hypothetical protein IKI02_07570 [Oscillospiraceae bacterium]|nr:hypothetical protein [Oscillospiraceae bacterium]
MSKSRWTPPKYNGTDLKHRGRLLMLICLCISADLLVGGLLHEKKLSALITSAGFFVLAFLNRYDPNPNNVGSIRILCFALLLLAVAIILISLHPWFWIIGVLQILSLALFAAWPYRKRILKNMKK